MLDGVTAMTRFLNLISSEPDVAKVILHPIYIWLIVTWYSVDNLKRYRYVSIRPTLTSLKRV